MKRILLIGRFILITIVIFACKKDTNPSYNTSSIIVVNAVEEPANIVVNFSDTALPYYLDQEPISFASSIQYGIPSGKTPIVVVASSDTTQPLTTMSVNLIGGGIYSLYIAGSGIPQTPVNAFLLKDTIPAYSDSVAGVRVINLSPASAPVSINLQGNSPVQTEFSNLAYEAISNFRSYPDTAGITQYTFEVRDQGTGNLLTTFSWVFTLFKNNTLVICGSEQAGSVTPISVFQINNF